MLRSQGDAREGMDSKRLLLNRMPWRWPHDPGQSILRRATRAALVIPSAFAFAKFFIGDVQVMSFVAFGCFALLVMADFGGPRRPRAAAYLTTVATGVLLITLGTLVSPVVWIATLTMFAVGFTIQFIGVFGSYVAAAQTALLLSFVLAVSVPGSISSIGARVAGWLIAGLVATLSGVFFWPLFEKLALRAKAADACSALASLFSALYGDRENSDNHQVYAAARAAVDEAKAQYEAAPKRPAGPTRRDRALVELLTELERMLKFATHPFRLQMERMHPCIDEGTALSDAMIRTLESSATVLTGGNAPELAELDAVRLAHRAALDDWATDALRSGRAPEEVLAGLDADHALRVQSYIAIAIGSNAVIAAGKQMGDELLPVGTPRRGRVRPLIRIARTIRTHLTWTSSVLHHSLRVGIGLALAVLLARQLRLDHAFWVVLGTLSVLRSNALGTGRTTIEALTGTVAGFIVGALFTIVAGATSPILWIAFPIVVFLATYASGGISFLVGQAAFTVLIIILFNLISPLGWRVGLARIEDVGVGVGISVVAGLLLWPRGARGALGAAAAASFRAIAGFLAGSFSRVLAPDSPDDAGLARRRAVQAHERAAEAFDQFLNERGAKPLDPESGAHLLSAGTHAILAGDLLNTIADMGYEAQNPSADIATLRAQAQLMLVTLLRLADSLEGTSSPLLSGTGVSDEALRAAALSSIRFWRDDPSQRQSALAVVMAGEWIQQLGGLTADLEAPVADMVQGNQVPWWR